MYKMLLDNVGVFMAHGVHVRVRGAWAGNTWHMVCRRMLVHWACATFMIGSFDEC